VKRTLFAFAAVASLALPAGAPATAASPGVHLLSDQLVTIRGVRHSIETWTLAGHRVRTDATELALRGGGVEQTLSVTRDGKALASVHARYTAQNGWKAAPEITFADGKHRRLDPIAYRPLRALDVAQTNARLSSRAWAEAHPRMQPAARRPQVVAQIVIEPLLSCGAICSVVTDGLGWGAYVLCYLACVSG
jgi:hypothetical protein